MPGECQGPLIGNTFEANAAACRTACQDAGGIGQGGCDWFTFHPDSDGLCALYDRCPTIDIASCPSCVTGVYRVTIQVDSNLLLTPK